MTSRVHGSASSCEVVSGNIGFYTLYLKDVDILSTGNILDISQQNFDDVVNIINLVSQPIIMNNPIPVNLAGIAPTITGAGFVFKFATEHSNIFERNGDSTAILKEAFSGIMIDDVLLIVGTNIEFFMTDLL
jgi:hypothetical protein